MATKDIDPIEKKSYTKYLFVVGGIFFLIANWAFYDEFIGRRTWRGYQQEFKNIELKKLSDEMDKAKALIDDSDKKKDAVPEDQTKSEQDYSLRKISLKIEEAEIKQDSKEYHEAEAELAKRKIKLYDSKQEYSFTKADQDEVFYEWKHALSQGHKEATESFKKEYYDLEERLVALKKVYDADELAVNEVQAILNKYDNDVKKWKNLEKKLLEPITKIQKKIDGVNERGLDIKQVVVNDLGKGGNIEWGAVDRCESCHMAINRDGFESEAQPFKTHPHRAEIFGKHPIEKYGCTTCHQGQGRATQIKGKPLEENDYVHGFEHHWTDPLLRGENVQSSCNKCHMDQWKLDYADVSIKGKKLFWDLGCTGCHAIKSFENAPKVGPSLEKVASKVKEEWLIEWIKNPKNYLPHTKMPKAPLNIDEPDQIEKVASYIFQSSKEFDFPYGHYTGGNSEQGQKLFESIGCMGCHSVGEKGGNLGPALDRIMEKTTSDWVYNWIQNPKRYNPNSKMPDLRLTSQEASDITAYLSTKGTSLAENSALRDSLKNPENAKKGYLLISQYGCYGCHNIKGFENASKLSVDLTSFGRKDVHELDFGDTKIPRTWKDWTDGKLKDPRMYLTERTSNRMPNFQLSDEDRKALVIFLQGMKKEDVSPKYVMSKVRPRQEDIDAGRRMIDHLNCKGCHMIEGEGRLIESVVSEKLPPILDGVGARVRPEFMYHFLKHPEENRVRWWFDIRMPTFHFTDDETNALIKYFAAMANKPEAFSSLEHPAFKQESLEAGAKLASAEAFNCFSCHVNNGKGPESPQDNWAPDLTKAHQRIRYDFIPEWVKDPQLITPGVRMPGFLPSDDAAVPDVLGADRQKQAEAIRDYIMSLGN